MTFNPETWALERRLQWPYIQAGAAEVNRSIWNKWWAVHPQYTPTANAELTHRLMILIQLPAIVLDLLLNVSMHKSQVKITLNYWYSLQNTYEIIVCLGPNTDYWSTAYWQLVILLAFQKFKTDLDWHSILPNIVSDTLYFNILMLSEIHIGSTFKDSWCCLGRAPLGGAVSYYFAGSVLLIPTQALPALYPTCTEQRPVGLSRCVIMKPFEPHTGVKSHMCLNKTDVLQLPVLQFHLWFSALYPPASKLLP